ncbi:helix-turn-helix domain-containing protein [Nocardia sp. NPDC088792]|uniref:TetR/AcrR family transcriptional regulator n=1 Tax=Nocardia sp. NPDC088792 TaxID=3364332 RepID=UPI0037F6DE6F
MSEGRRVNRGPGAAADNRAALIAAARDTFTEIGFHAPLSLVARRAGVGQGSLYRHFPDRESLTLAVFEDNVTGLETFAANPEITLEDVLDRVIEELTAVTAVVADLDPTTTDSRITGLAERLRTLLAAKLDADRTTTPWRADLSADELVLAVAMLASLLAHADAAARPELADRAWNLLRRGLAP